MEIENTNDFKEALEQIDVIKQQLQNYALDVLGGTKFTAEQLQEMGDYFWKWIYEGAGYDYFPQLDFFCPELNYSLDQCIGDSNQLEIWFEMVDYE